MEPPRSLGALVVYQGRGRPSSFTWEIATEICERISVGESLNSIVKSSHMPDYKTVMRWLVTANEVPHLKQFRLNYARAREAQAEFFVDQLYEIASDGSNDWEERETQNGNVVTVINHEVVARSRLRMDAIKWIAGKQRPKKYADKFAELAAQDDTPIDGGSLNDSADKLSERDRGRRLAFVLAKGLQQKQGESA